MVEAIKPVETGSSERPFQHQEWVKYNDGEIDLRFDHRGDRIVWGQHRHADPEFSPEDRVLVRTESGNTYIVAEGLIINTGTSGVFDMEDMPSRLPDITIGRSWDIPGVARTSDVKEVLLRWKIDTPGIGEEVVDKPSPFVVAEKWLEAVRAALGTQASE